MSHTRILDKIREHFVKLTSAEPRTEGLPKNATNPRELYNEHRQKGDFNCKAFMDVSTEMIAQFFE